ncbi:F-box domain-containing protein, partial [Meloidogyne graminicola]
MDIKRDEKTDYTLPTEVLVKILGHLDFHDLYSFKRTCKKFNSTINLHQNLFRHKFNHLFLETSDEPIIYDEKALKFQLDNDLLIHWQNSLENRICTYINLKREPIDQKLTIFLEGVAINRNVIIKLLVYPTSIEELKIVRYWLLLIYKCDIGDIDFTTHIFNPEIIRLIFNESLIKLECQILEINFYRPNLNLIEFTYSRIIIKRKLILYFERFIRGEDNSSLIAILINEGRTIPEIYISRPTLEQIFLYNELVNYLSNSRNLSKVIRRIEFEQLNWKKSNLKTIGVKTVENNRKIIYLLQNYWK